MSAVAKLVPLPASPPRLEPGDILTPEELAQRLKVPLSWVYKHSGGARKRSLPVLRCDGFLRFSWPDVCEWMRGKG